MSEDAFVKIPGTTFTIKIGFEGKYYAVYLCRGLTPFKNEKLSILKDAPTDDFPQEVKGAINKLLESEELFLSPVVVNRVTNDLLDHKTAISTAETESEDIVEKETSVKELVSKSEIRAEKKSVIEHTPGAKSAVDASADDIGKIKLKEPKPLPERDSNPAITKPAPKVISTAPSYAELETKVSNLTNELESIQETLTKNKNAITGLKRQITILKKELKKQNEN